MIPVPLHARARSRAAYGGDRRAGAVDYGHGVAGQALLALLIVDCPAALPGQLYLRVQLLARGDAVGGQAAEVRCARVLLQLFAGFAGEHGLAQGGLVRPAPVAEHGVHLQVQPAQHLVREHHVAGAVHDAQVRRLARLSGQPAQVRPHQPGEHHAALRQRAERKEPDAQPVPALRRAREVALGLQRVQHPKRRRPAHPQLLSRLRSRQLLAVEEQVQHVESMIEGGENILGGFFHVFHTPFLYLSIILCSYEEHKHFIFRNVF